MEEIESLTKGSSINDVGILEGYKLVKKNCRHGGGGIKNP